MGTHEAFRPSASDSADALYERGKRHARGDGVPKDSVAAARWFEQAAAQGHPKAQYALYLLHEVGERPARDEGQPMQWLHAAASAGLVDAMFDLGAHYSKGRGVPKDARKAAQWFRRASERGEPRSQLALAVMHVTGDGVPENRVEAMKWLILCERGSLDEAHRLLAASRLESLRKVMEPAEAAEARRLADAWRRQEG